MAREPKNPEPQSDSALRMARNLHLEGLSLEAFLRLCQMGCDARSLGDRLWRLTAQPIRVDRPEGQGYVVEPRAMDSWEAALGRFGPAELRRLRVRLLSLAVRLDQVKRDCLDLQRTRFVRSDDPAPWNWVKRVEWHSVPQIEACVSLLEDWARDVGTIVEKTSKIGPRQRPEFSRILCSICLYVKKATGSDNDKLVSEVMNPLLPDGGYTTDALKQWRTRHCRKGPDVVTRKVDG